MQVRVFLLCLLGAVGVFGQTPSFPSQVASDLDLLVACSASESTLSTALDSTSTTVTVASSASFCQYQMIQIDNERMVICSVGSGTLTLCTGTRGFDGTSAASHRSGTAVRGLVGRYHHNRMREEVQAIETALGANLVNIPTLSSEFTVAGQIPKAVTSSGRVMEPSTCKEVGGVFSCGSGTSPGQIDVKNQTGPTLTEPSTGMSGYGASSTGAPLFRTYGSSTVELVTSSTGVTSASTIGDGKLVVGSGGSRGVAASSLTGIVKSTSGTPSAAGYADVTALWASGACSGYLKSDGTCSTIAVDLTTTMLSDEFVGVLPAQALGWKIWVDGTGAGVHTDYGSGTAVNHPGVVYVDSGTANNGYAQFYLADYYGSSISQGTLRDGVWEAHWIFKAGTLTNGHVSIGFASNYGECLPGAAGGLAAVVDSAQSNIMYYACTDSICTTQDSGVAKNTNWHRLKIYRLSGDTPDTVRFCLDSCSSSWQATSNVGIGDSFRMAPSAVSKNSASGTTSNRLQVDRFDMLITGQTRY